MCFDTAEQFIEILSIDLGQRCNRVMSEQQFLGFLFVEIDYQHRQQCVASDLGTQMAIDQLQVSVRQFASDHCIGKTNSSEQATKGSTLIRGMRTPVFWVCVQLVGPNTAKLFDAIADHDGFVS